MPIQDLEKKAPVYQKKDHMKFVLPKDQKQESMPAKPEDNSESLLTRNRSHILKKDLLVNPK